MDKEYILLSEIDRNSNITQRELSKKTELSLGSVNFLLNKMVHEGFIKIKQIPMNRVAYMLTPKGMAEKVAKTSSYIKSHYSYINETKKKIQFVINDLLAKNSQVTILLEKDEISDLVRLAMENRSDINITSDAAKVNGQETIVVVSTDMCNKVKEKCGRVVNLLELI